MAASKRILLAACFALALCAGACGGGGGASSVTYYSNTGTSLTLNPDGTLLLKFGDGSSLTGTYTKDSTGKVFSLHTNSGLFQSATGTINSAGCLEVTVTAVGQTVGQPALCPGAPPAATTGAGGLPAGASLTLVGTDPSDGTLTIYSDGTISLTRSGQVTNGTYTKDASGKVAAVQFPAGGQSRPVTYDAAGCLAIIGSTRAVTYCPAGAQGAPSGGGNLAGTYTSTSAAGRTMTLNADGSCSSAGLPSCRWSSSGSYLTISLQDLSGNPPVGYPMPIDSAGCFDATSIGFGKFCK